MDNNTFLEEKDDRLREAIKLAGIEQVDSSFVPNLMSKIESIENEEALTLNVAPLISNRAWIVLSIATLALITFLLSPFAVSNSELLLKINTDYLNNLFTSIGISRFFLYGILSLVSFFSIEVILLSKSRNGKVKILKKNYRF